MSTKGFNKPMDNSNRYNQSINWRQPNPQKNMQRNGQYKREFDPSRQKLSIKRRELINYKMMNPIQSKVMITTLETQFPMT